MAPDTTASIAADLSQGEAAVEGSAFVGFQGTQQLYTSMLDRRQQHRVACTGAHALGSLFRRAKVFLRMPLLTEIASSMDAAINDTAKIRYRCAICSFYDCCKEQVGISSICMAENSAVLWCRRCC